MAELLTIRKAAELAELPPKTIRYYEEAGLLPEAQRNDAGYRLYAPADIRRMKLIRRAKILGLPLKEIKQLADLAFMESCGSFEAQLESLIAQRLADIERTMTELAGLKAELEGMQVTLRATTNPCSNCRADECERCRFIDD
jgi:MerR family transcriptional regulator, copper efflux regulator